MRLIKTLMIVIFLSTRCWAAEKTERVTSPNQKVTIKVTIDEAIHYSVLFWGRSLLVEMPISMSFAEDITLGKNPEIVNVARHEIQRTLKRADPKNKPLIQDHCNEMRLSFKGRYVLVMRAYNDAVAYRWVTYFKTVNPSVKSEEVVYQFRNNAQVLFPEQKSRLPHSEPSDTPLKLSTIPANHIYKLPVLVDIPRGPKVLITEADVKDYPNLYLKGSEGLALTGYLPAVGKREEQNSDRTVTAVQQDDYIAETHGNRSYPWRVAIIGATKEDLLNNDTVYKLRSSNEPKPKSTSK